MIGDEHIINKSYFLKGEGLRGDYNSICKELAGLGHRLEGQRASYVCPKVSNPEVTVVVQHYMGDIEDYNEGEDCETVSIDFLPNVTNDAFSDRTKNLQEAIRTIVSGEGFDEIKLYI